MIIDIVPGRNAGDSYGALDAEPYRSPFEGVRGRTWRRLPHRRIGRVPALETVIVPRPRFPPNRQTRIAHASGGYPPMAAIRPVTARVVRRPGAMALFMLAVA